MVTDFFHKRNQNHHQNLKLPRLYNKNKIIRSQITDMGQVNHNKILTTKLTNKDYHKRSNKINSLNLKLLLLCVTLEIQE